MAGGKQNKLVDMLAITMVCFGLFAANLALVVLVIELVEWLTGGEWPGLSIADGLAVFGVVHELPESDSDRLVDLLMAIPLTICLFVLGLILILRGIKLGDPETDGASEQISEMQRCNK